MRWIKCVVVALLWNLLTANVWGQAPANKFDGEPNQPEFLTYIVEFPKLPVGLVKKDNQPAHLKVLKVEHDQFVTRLRQALQITANDTVEVLYTYTNVINGLAFRFPVQRADRFRQLADGIADYRFTADYEVRSQLVHSVPQIRADIVQSNGVTGKGVVIAILDSGIDYRHRDLGGGLGPSFKVLGGYDFVNKDNDPLDDFGHGTHVAGIAAAQGAIRGVAPDAKLLAYKVLNSSGSGSASQIIAGIERAADPDQDPNTNDAADIINLSLGGRGHSYDSLSRACDNAVRMGIVCVVAAGNSGEFELNSSPAASVSAITVGSVGPTNQLSSFSNKGPSPLYGVKPDLLAPGESIVSTAIGGGSKVMSGTSMACPHVAGVAALVLEKWPTATPLQVKSLLTTTALDCRYSILEQGSGRVDALAAVESSTSVEPGSINFDQVSRNIPVWSATASMRITNRSAQPIEYRATVDAGTLELGVTATVTGPITVAPQAVGELQLTLTVDTAKCPPWRGLPLVHQGLVTVEGGGTKWRVPFVSGDEQPDEFEPNDTTQQATAIELTSQRRLIQKGGRTRIEVKSPDDVDWYKFPATKGQVLCAYLDARVLGSTLVPRFEVYDPDMRVITYGGLDDDKRLALFPINKNGTHYFKVYPESSTSTGPYRLFANVLPPDVNYWSPELSNPVDATRFIDNGARFQQSQMRSVVAQFQTPTSIGTTPMLTPEFVVTGGRGVWGAELTIGLGGNTGVAWTPNRFASPAFGGFLATSRSGPVSVIATGRSDTNELWTLNSTGKWVKQEPARSPPPRENASLIHDPERKVVWLMGGYADGVYLNDVWRWDGTNWEDRSPALVSRPQPRYSPRLAYDADRKVVVMYGGYLGFIAGGSAFDHWEWDGATWTRIVSPATPKAYWTAITYDARRRLVVLVEPGTRKMWEHNAAARTWTERTDGQLPSSELLGMAYDSMRQEVFLLTKAEQSGRTETWSWDGTAWKRWTYQFPVNAVIYGGTLYFDSLAQRLRFLSYQPYSVSTEARLWSLESTGWELVPATDATQIPPSAGVVFDPDHNQLLYFGGSGPMWDKLEFRRSPDAAVIYQEDFKTTDRLSGLMIPADGNSVVLTQANKLQVRNAAGASVRSWDRTAPANIADITTDGSIASLEEFNAARTDVVANVIIDTTTGQERLRKLPTFGRSLALDGTGRLLIEPRGRAVYAHMWNTATKAYDFTWRFVSDPDEVFFAANCSANGSLVTVVGARPGNIPGEAGVSVHLLDGPSGKLLARYHRDDDHRINRLDGLSEFVTNADGTLVGISTWGRDHRHPEVFALSRESGTPIWELGTPGSARSLDLVGSKLVVGTKGVHANIGRGGGEVYVADLSSLATKIAPNVTRVTASPTQSAPGTAVLILADVKDTDGMANVVAQIESPRDRVVARLPMLDDGRHGDGAANDGLWSVCWGTEPRAADYVVTIVATDAQGNVGTTSCAANFTTLPNPWITVEGNATEQDHWIEGRNRFGLTLRNRGVMAANQVQVLVSSNAKGVTRDTDNEANSQSVADLAPSQELTLPSVSFALTLDASGAALDAIPITVLIKDGDGHRWIEQSVLRPKRNTKSKVE